MNESFDVIIPCRDMGSSLDELLLSIQQADIVSSANNIIIVNDGSINSDVENIINKWSIQFPNKIISVPFFPSIGRFKGRFEAAKKAKSKFCFFIDARVLLPKNFIQQWNKIPKNFLKSYVILPSLKIDESKSLFHLYWLRTHQFLFKKSFPKENEYHVIDEKNFSEYVVGTTALFCHREEFLQACSELVHKKNFNDDTALLKILASRMKIYRSGFLQIQWGPRDNLVDFLRHIGFQRGLTFAEYHLFTHWGLYSWAFLFAALFLYFSIFQLLIHANFYPFILGLCIAICSGIFISKKMKELLPLIFLHLLVLIVFFMGVQRGVLFLLFSNKKEI